MAFEGGEVRRTWLLEMVRTAWVPRTMVWNVCGAAGLVLGAAYPSLCHHYGVPSVPPPCDVVVAGVAAALLLNCARHAS